jgi:hypothetical protein
MTNDDMKECINACNDCRDECEKVLFQHCIEKGGKHVEPMHMRLMADCIEICQTAANFMLRGSSMHEDICKACADICDACADSCDEVGGKDMEHCAETCRDCADMCRSMGRGKRQSREDADIPYTGFMA